MKITNTMAPVTKFNDLPFDSWFLDNYGNLCYKSGHHKALVFDGDEGVIDTDLDYDGDEHEHYVIAVVDVEIRIVPLKEED